MRKLQWAVRAALADLILAAEAGIGESSTTIVDLFQAAKSENLDVADYAEDVEKFRTRNMVERVERGVDSGR